MECPNCKSKLTNNSKYCPRCGLLFKSNDVEKYSERHNSNLLEQYLSNNLDSRGFPNLYYILFGWYYSILKKMFKTSIYLFFCFLIFILAIYNIDGIALFCIQIYPVGFSLLLILSIFIIRLHFKILTNLIYKDCINKLYKIIKNNSNINEEKIIEIIKNDNSNNISGLIIAIVISLLFLILSLLF